MDTKISKSRWLTGTIILSGIMIFGIGSVACSDKENWNHEARERASKTMLQQDAIYTEECGACHFAYPPGLLPLESWQKIMAELDDHFGENAELDTETSSHIINYIEQQVSQKKLTRHMNKLLRNLPKTTPIRITELPYFIHEHDEIPKKMIIDNPKVGSLSQCNSCHKDAERGEFDEDWVFIPGIGHWDD